MREHGDRLGRLADEIATVESELRAPCRRRGPRPGSACRRSGNVAGRGRRGGCPRIACGGVAFRSPPGARPRPPTARRSRAKRAAARHRSQDTGKASACRHQEFLAGSGRSISRSKRATRPRSAPRSATTSKLRSTRRRRCAGRARPSTRPIRLPDGVEPLGRSRRGTAGAGAAAGTDRRDRA